MRKRFVFSIIVVAFCLFCFTLSADQQPEKRVMNFLAVMNLNCGAIVNKENCNALTDVVIEELVRAGKYTVIDRANRDKILGEAKFQMTGCVADSCTIEAGRILGVGKMVVGSVTKIGETYLVTLQLLNVETAAVETATREKCEQCKLDNLIDTVTNAALKLMGEAPVPTSPSGTQPGARNEGMVLISAGEFLMGGKTTPELMENNYQGCYSVFKDLCKREWYTGEIPQHSVRLDAYYIDKYDVTVQQYATCVQAGKCSAAHFDDGKCILFTGDSWKTEVLPQSFRGPSQPVVCVDWSQARTYCEGLGKRLPTEAEWEKAARGTDGREFPWGNEWNPRNANYCDASCKASWRDTSYNDGYETTSPVGSFPPGASPYGVMDMAGNVKQWVEDWYDANYYKNSPIRNPTGPSFGSERVWRGGAWWDGAYALRSSFRYGTNPDYSFNGLGFRCARTP